jgi:hypothetical protein
LGDGVRPVALGRDILQPGDPLLFAGAGLAGYWHGDLGVTATSVVDQWDDRSGNAVNFSATLTTRPAYSRYGLNGHGVLTFDGSNDGMLASGVDMFGNSAYTWLAVMKFTTTAAFKIAFGNAGTGGGGMYFAIHSGVGNRRISHPGAFDSTGGVATAGWEIVTIRRAAGAAPTLRINGANDALSGAGTTMTVPTTPNVHVGYHTTGLFPQPMSIAFLSALTVAWTDAQAVAAENWARNTWALP